MRIAIAIDPTTNDIFFRSNKSLAIVTEAEAVGQHVRKRLLTYDGEWFLDTAAGVTWLTEILARKYDPALAESVVKAEILETDGVTSIESFSVSFEKRTRGLRIRDVAVMTEYDVKVQI